MMLESVFDKLRQDHQNLERCADCTKDLEINASDRLQVVGLLEFVKYGLSPVEKGEDSKAIFTEFFNKNSAVLSKIA